MADSALEAVIKDCITVVYNNETYNFRIPTFGDRVEFNREAVRLRNENAKDGTNIVALGLDANLVAITFNIAKFTTLLRDTTATWVYSPGKDGHATIDPNKWPVNAPVEEVLNQFDAELDRFLEVGGRNG